MKNKNELNATQYWIEEFRKWLEVKIDKRIYDKDMYELLEISSSAFSRYTRGDRTMNEDMAMEIAHYMEVPVMKILGEINAEKAKNDKLKSKWQKLAKDAVAGVASVGMIGIMTMTMPNTNIEASIEIIKNTDKTVYTLYELKQMAKKWYKSFLESLSNLTRLIYKEFYKCENLAMNF